MLFGILRRCNLMTETCDGLCVLGGKQNHPGLDKAATKSTAGDGLINWENQFFEDLNFALVEIYRAKIQRINCGAVQYLLIAGVCRLLRVLFRVNCISLNIPIVHHISISFVFCFFKAF
jgi:hypothetical protein